MGQSVSTVKFWKTHSLKGELIKGRLMPRCSKRGPSQELRLVSSLTRTPFPHGFVSTTGRHSSFNSPSRGWDGNSCTAAQGFPIGGKRGHKWDHSGQLKNISALKALTVKTFGEGSQSSACEGCVELLHVETLFFFLNICAIHKRLSVKKVKAALNTTRTLFYCSISSFLCSKWMQGQLCLIIINCIF